MRKNKKLLLASVAAMGALALGVGATSTFAWFRMTTTGAVKNSTGDASLGTVAPDGRAVDLPLKITASAGTATVELVTYLDAGERAAVSLTAAGTTAGDSGADYYHAYYDVSQSKALFQKASLTAGAVDFSVITFTITALPNHLKADGSEWNSASDDPSLNVGAYVDEDGKMWSSSDIATALNGKKIDINISRAAVTNPVVNRGYYFLGADNTTAPTALPSSSNAEKATLALASDVSVGTTAQLGGTSPTEYKFGVYVDGGNASQDDGTTVANVVGNPLITVSAHSA